MRYLFLSSWTGGGHMAAANAVADALRRQDAGAVTAIEDILRGCRQFPLSRFPDVYGPLVNHLPGLWTALWSVSDAAPTVDLISYAGWPLVSGHLRDLVRDFRPDVLIPVHPLLVRPAVRLASRSPGLRVACIVTDLVRLHSFWLSRHVDLYLVPSAEAAAAALAAGVPREKVVVCGQPIPAGPPRSLTRAQAKAAMGLDPDRPLAVLTGGGAGSGPLAAVSEALTRVLDPSVQTVVVCGRNETLRRRLAGRPGLTRVLGFVPDMPLWLRAADVLITKAGPNAVAEAMAEGLPTVIVAALPGQETDNVRYCCTRGAAIWAPSPAQAADEVVRLLAQPLHAAALSRRARASARPQSADDIARHLAALGGRGRERVSAYRS